MKLDENVCRGSLVIINDQTHIIVGKCQQTRQHSPTVHNMRLVPGYKTCFLDNGDYVIRGEGIALEDEVDMFFPGAVYELPDYIK